MKKLTGKGGIWRIRVGDYRILYQIFDQRMLILVVSIGHRSKIYR